MKPDMNELLDSIRYLMDRRDALVETYDDRIKQLMALLQTHMLAERRGRLHFAGATAYFKEEKKVEVSDWDTVMRYVKENNAFDILQKRVAPAQVALRLDAGEEIKGVKLTKVKTLAIRRGEENESD